MLLVFCFEVEIHIFEVPRPPSWASYFRFGHTASSFKGEVIVNLLDTNMLILLYVFRLCVSHFFSAQLPGLLVSLVNVNITLLLTVTMMYFSY